MRIINKQGDDLTIWVIFLACLVVVGLAVSIPSITLILESLHVQEAPEFSLGNYTNILNSQKTWVLMLNTVAFAVIMTILSGALGFLFAWIAARTNAPLRAWMPVAVLLPYIIPPSLGAICWIFLLSPSNGLLNQLAVWALGYAPFNIYSFSGMVFVETLYTLPLSFTFLYASLSNTNGSLEEASSVCGARTFQTFRFITLPLMLPSIISVATLLLIIGLESFDVAWFVGYPAKIYTLSIEMFLLTRYNYPSDIGAAAVFGVIALILAFLLVGLYRWVTRDQNRFASISGKAFRPSMLDLGRWRIAASVLFYVVMAIIGLLPVLLLLGLAIDNIRWPFRIAGEFSLDSFRWVLTQNQSRAALINTALIAIFGAVAVVALSFLVSYVTVRSKVAGRGLLDYLAFLPFAFPGTVLAVGIIAALITTPLYNTLWILLIAFAIKFLPYGLRSMSNNMLQIHRELEEASFVSGASLLQTLRLIMLPLTAPGMLAAWSLLIIIFARQFSLPLMLSSSGSEVLTIVLFQQFDAGKMENVAAYGLLLVGCTIPLIILARKVGRETQSL